MAAMKDLWRGTFKIGNTASVLYAYASSEKQARVILCRRIAKKDGVPFGAVISSAEVSINKEVEFQEVEE